MEKKYILIINGYPLSGKGLFTQKLSKISHLPLFEYSSIDYIKEVAKNQFRWDGRKTPKGRRLLAKLKDISIEYNNLPFKKIISKEEVISEVKDHFIYCIDVREPKEIQKLINFYSKKLYSVYTICIRRNSVEKKIQSNSADSGVHDFIYNHYIENNGTIDEFEEKIKSFYEGIVK